MSIWRIGLKWVKYLIEDYMKELKTGHISYPRQIVWKFERKYIFDFGKL